MFISLCLEVHERHDYFSDPVAQAALKTLKKGDVFILPLGTKKGGNLTLSLEKRKRLCWVSPEKLTTLECPGPTELLNCGGPSEVTLRDPACLRTSHPSSGTLSLLHLFSLLSPGYC